VSLWGGLLRLGYRLGRHRIGPLPLGYWPLLVGVLWLIVAGRTAAGPYALALSLTGFILTGIMLIARRQAYIRFRPDESLAAHLPPDVAPIEADEKIPIQATGTLRVRNSRRYFVEAATDFATMENREHIVMARIPVSRIWLVAKSSQEEEGWWYAFVKPAHIRGIQTGWLYHGLRLRPALKLVYLHRQLIEGKKKTKEVTTEETLYLSAADPLTIHRLLEDLVRDAGRPVEHQQYVPL
jgi:hypothetical protein